MDDPIECRQCGYAISEGEWDDHQRWHRGCPPSCIIAASTPHSHATHEERMLRQLERELGINDHAAAGASGTSAAGAEGR